MAIILFSSLSISQVRAYLCLQHAKAQCTSNSIKNGIFEETDLLNKEISAIGGLDTVNRIKGITQS